MTDSLFGSDEEDSRSDAGHDGDYVHEEPPLSIDGLTIFRNFISYEQEKDFFDWLEEAAYFAESEGDGKRKEDGRPDQLMFFGFESGFPEPLKVLSKNLCKKLEESSFDRTDLAFDQAIINLYSPNDGLHDHIDLVHRFDNLVIVLSIGSGIGMRFSKEGREYETFELYLPRRSLLCLKDEARYDWKHGIAARDEDIVMISSGLAVFPRSLRLSLTLRKMLPGADNLVVMDGL